MWIKYLVNFNSQMWSGATTISWLTFRLILCRSLLNKLERGELTLIAPHRTQLPLAFAFSFHCWPSALSALPCIWKMSSNSSAGVGWYVRFSRAAPPVLEEGGWLLDEYLEGVANVTYFLSVFHRCWRSNFMGVPCLLLRNFFECELALLIVLREESIWKGRSRCYY